MDDYETLEQATVPVPFEVYRKLKTGLATYAARQALADYESGMPVPHAGGLFGPVMSWLWFHDRDDAMLTLADYLGELFEHAPRAHLVDPPRAHLVDPPLTFEQAIRGLKYGMGRASGVDFDEFESTARARIPQYYSGIWARMTG